MEDVFFYDPGGDVFKMIQAHFIDCALYFFLIYFFIEGSLLYRIFLFSVKPQHESAIGIDIFPPF